MSKLNLIQQQFSDALFAQENKIQLLDFMNSDYPSERLNIYRQTIIQNLRQALEITYPGIWVLLGKECANSVAYSYINNINHLPNTGCLDDWGESFSDFLDKKPELKMLPYLKDFAQYEWFKHLAYREAESNCVSYNDLNNLSEKILEQSKLILHPSLYIMKSEFQLDKILELVENFDASGFELKRYQTYALIFRSESGVMTYWITEDNFFFFQNILNQHTLAECFKNTEKNYPDFKFSEAFSFLMSCKLISSMIYK